MGENTSILGEAVPEPATTTRPLPEPASGDIDGPADLPVYYTKNGRYYHGTEHCSDMMHAAAHTLSETKAAGKQRCPVCLPGGEPEHYERFRQDLGLELSNLYPGYVYHHTGEYADVRKVWVLWRRDPQARAADPAAEYLCAVTVTRRRLSALEPSGLQTERARAPTGAPGRRRWRPARPRMCDQAALPASVDFLYRILHKKLLLFPASCNIIIFAFGDTNCADVAQ